MEREQATMTSRTLLLLLLLYLQGLRTSPSWGDFDSHELQADARDDFRAACAGHKVCQEMPDAKI